MLNQNQSLQKELDFVRMHVKPNILLKRSHSISKSPKNHPVRFTGWRRTKATLNLDTALLTQLKANPISKGSVCEKKTRLFRCATFFKGHKSFKIDWVISLIQNEHHILQFGCFHTKKKTLMFNSDHYCLCVNSNN